MSTALPVSPPFDRIRPSLSEATWLRGLGLAPWSTTTGVEVHVGDVRPFADWENASKDTVISIYVYPTPALSYRFEILRASEQFDGMESVTIKTGSSLPLADVWEMALAVASHALSVSVARSARAGGGQ